MVQMWWQVAVLKAACQVYLTWAPWMTNRPDKEFGLYCVVACSMPDSEAATKCTTTRRRTKWRMEIEELRVLHLYIHLDIGNKTWITMMQRELSALQGLF